MIRNVCIHVSNEQPLLADLYDMPSAADAGLVCTNVRSMDGKRPVFIDHIGSTFFFPYHVVRFLEIPEREMERYYAEGPRRSPLAQPAVTGADAGAPSPVPDGEWAAPRAAGGDGGGMGREDGTNGNGSTTGNGHGGPGPAVDVAPGSLLPVAVAVDDDPTVDDDGELELEIDEGFLQRIRDL